MSSTPRQTQHRAKREGRKARELADLKRSQHQLVEESRRLQEALAKTTRPRIMKVVDEEFKPAAKQPQRSKNPCPDCGGPLHLVDLGRFEMWACPACKYHRKAES